MAKENDLSFKPLLPENGAEEEEEEEAERVGGGREKEEKREDVERVIPRLAIAAVAAAEVAFALNFKQALIIRFYIGCESCKINFIYIYIYAIYIK